MNDGRPLPDARRDLYTAMPPNPPPTLQTLTYSSQSKRAEALSLPSKYQRHRNIPYRL